MNAVEQYINAMNIGWNVMNAGTRHLVDNQVLDGIERAYCEAFVAFSDMSKAVFAAYSEWL